MLVYPYLLPVHDIDTRRQEYGTFAVIKLEALYGESVHRIDAYRDRTPGGYRECAPAGGYP